MAARSKCVGEVPSSHRRLQWNRLATADGSDTFSRSGRLDSASGLSVQALVVWQDQ